MERKNIRPVILKWIDSQTIPNGWTNADEAIGQAIVDMYCFTSGFLIHEADDAYLIALSINFSDDHTIHDVNGLIAIPKVCVLECVTVRSDICRPDVEPMR